MYSAQEIFQHHFQSKKVRTILDKIRWIQSKSLNLTSAILLEVANRGLKWIQTHFNLQARRLHDFWSKNICPKDIWPRDISQTDYVGLTLTFFVMMTHLVYLKFDRQLDQSITMMGRLNVCRPKVFWLKDAALHLNIVFIIRVTIQSVKDPLVWVGLCQKKETAVVAISRNGIPLERNLRSRRWTGRQDTWRDRLPAARLDSQRWEWSQSRPGPNVVKLFLSAIYEFL